MPCCRVALLPQGPLHSQLNRNVLVSIFISTYVQVFYCFLGGISHCSSGWAAKCSSAHFDSILRTMRAGLPTTTAKAGTDCDTGKSQVRKVEELPATGTGRSEKGKGGVANLGDHASCTHRHAPSDRDVRQDGHVPTEPTVVTDRDRSAAFGASSAVPDCRVERMRSRKAVGGVKTSTPRLAGDRFEAPFE